jgi:hypothetical protein
VRWPAWATGWLAWAATRSSRGPTLLPQLLWRLLPTLTTPPTVPSTLLLRLVALACDSSVLKNKTNKKILFSSFGIGLSTRFTL